RRWRRRCGSGPAARSGGCRWRSSAVGAEGDEVLAYDGVVVGDGLAGAGAGGPKPEEAVVAAAVGFEAGEELEAGAVGVVGGGVDVNDRDVEDVAAEDVRVGRPEEEGGLGGAGAGGDVADGGEVDGVSEGGDGDAAELGLRLERGGGGQLVEVDLDGHSFHGGPPAYSSSSGGSSPAPAPEGFGDMGMEPSAKARPPGTNTTTQRSPGPAPVARVTGIGFEGLSGMATRATASSMLTMSAACAVVLCIEVARSTASPITAAIRGQNAPHSSSISSGVKLFTGTAA